MLYIFFKAKSLIIMESAQCYNNILNGLKWQKQRNTEDAKHSLEMAASL